MQKFLPGKSEKREKHTNFASLFLRSSSRSELQILQVYVTPYPLPTCKIFFRSENFFFCFCPRIRPCLSACFLRSSSRSELQILHVYVIYLPPPMCKIFFRCENIFFCFCLKNEMNFHRDFLTSSALLTFQILHAYVIYLHTPLPKIIFRSENFFLLFLFQSRIELSFLLTRVLSIIMKNPFTYLCNPLPIIDTQSIK